MTFSDLTPENTITDASGNVIGVSGSPLHVTGANTAPLPVSLPLDPFGRFVTAEPHTLFEFGHYTAGLTSRIWASSTTGSGAYTLNTNTSSIEASVTTASGDKIEIKTRRNIHYIRGKAQLLYLSCRPADMIANMRQRWGHYSSTDGVYFETDGTTMYVVRRSSTSGSTVNTRIAQSAWDDPMDGTGASGETLDLTDSKQELYFCEWSYLGTNVIRWGIVRNAQKIIMHEESYSGVLESMWAKHPYFPVHYEVENTGTAASASTFHMNCGAVISNGGLELGYNVFAPVNTGTSTKSLSTTPVLVAAARLRSGKEYASARPFGFEIQPNSGNTVVYWRILLNPSITGGSWSNVGFLLDGLTSYTSYTGGTVISAGYFDLGTSGSGATKGGLTSSILLNSDVYIGSDIAGASDIIAMEMQTISSTGSVFFSGTVKEYI